MNHIVNFALAGVISLLAVSAMAADSDMNAPAGSPTNPADRSSTGGIVNSPGTGMAGTSKSYPDLKTLDSNKDGRVSLDEYMKQGGTEDAFRQRDLNRDNKLDKSELAQ